MLTSRRRQQLSSTGAIKRAMPFTWVWCYCRMCYYQRYESKVLLHLGDSFSIRWVINCLLFKSFSRIRILYRYISSSIQWCSLTSFRLFYLSHFKRDLLTFMKSSVWQQPVLHKNCDLFIVQLQQKRAFSPQIQCSQWRCFTQVVIDRGCL